MAKSSNFAYDVIRSRILDGSYPPESHLREGSIAVEIGVSRTPVREALRRLAADGFVRLLPNQGAFVMPWSVEDSRQLIEVRAELAGLAAAGAALHAGPRVVDQIAAIVSRMERISRTPTHEQVDEQTRLNVEFQNLIFEHCGNRWLRQLLQQTANIGNIQRTYYAFQVAGWNRAIERYHELVDALRTGDSLWAGAILKAHFLASRHAVVSESVRRGSRARDQI